MIGSLLDINETVDALLAMLEATIEREKRSIEETRARSQILIKDGNEPFVACWEALKKGGNHR